MLILFWILCAIAAAMIGSSKDRAGRGLLLGFLFGPIGILLTFLIKGDRKQCPFCKEYIHSMATKCSKCQSNLLDILDPLSQTDFYCPSCKMKLQIDGHVAGQKGRCPECGNIFETPISHRLS